MFTSISCSVLSGEASAQAQARRQSFDLSIETSQSSVWKQSVFLVVVVNQSRQRRGGGARVPRTKGGTVKFAKTCQTWWISCGSAPSQVLVRCLCRLPGPDSVWHCVVIICLHCLQNQLRRRSTGRYNNWCETQCCFTPNSSWEILLR